MNASPAHRPVVWVAQSYWVDPIFRGIAKYAAERGWSLDARMRWQRAGTPPPQRKPDGVIVFTGDMKELIPLVRGLGVPVVDIEAYVDHYGAAKVLGDDPGIGVLAARHLAGCSPKRLVVIADSPASRTVRERLAGFRREAKETGLGTTDSTLADFDPVALTKDGPIGVFGGNDHAALEVLRRCLDAGVRVPEDVAILGCDDTEFICDLSPVPLSSIDVAFEEKGRRAAELLDRLMRGEPAPPAPIVVGASGVSVRTSTIVIRTGHAELDGLIRHFRENAHRPVSVDILCEEFGMPIRTAQHLLKKRRDMTPHELLTGFRMEIVKRLGANGKLTRDALARAGGFGGRAALARAEKSSGAK